MAQAVVAPEAAGRPLVVGVGASAGGLEAVQAFLRGLPPGSGLAVVVVFHLDPAAKSLLPEVLARHSPLPVVEATDGLAVEPDHVYTAPPHSAVAVRDGAFRLTPLDPSPARRTPIDHLLQSLADDRRVRAAAVILSGAGSDGTLGLKAVSDSGGVTFVQDPSTAKHDGMPQSALTTAAVDHVLPPGQLAAELLAYASHLRTVAEPAEEVDLARQVEAALPAVCDILLHARGHNFRHYKTSTLVRRVMRRLQVLRLGSARQYVERLRADAVEAEQLFNDLLINVTAFFRDPEAFAMLAAEVLPKLFDGRTHDQPVRIWCAGCATGEEAYTLAMLVREGLVS